MRTLQCGACGSKLFSLHTPQNIRREQCLSLIAKCQSCGSETVVAPVPVALDFDWGQESEGILCDFGEKE
jgi:hypothetical protein